MTDFPTIITEDEAETFLQICIGGDESSGKFANNKNNSGVGSQTAVSGTALWNFIYHQGKGSGIPGTNYVYGRNANGNVKDFKDIDRIFYNPVGDGTNTTYGRLDNTLTGVVNHGLYTHWREITLTGTGIATITAPKQSILTTDGTTGNTEIYGTGGGTVNLLSNLPKSDKKRLGPAIGTQQLLAADLVAPSFRLDTFSAVSLAFNTNYININAANSNLGSASYHLGGMYDLLIDTPQPLTNGVFGTAGVFDGTNNKGPIIGANQYETNIYEGLSTQTGALFKGNCFIPRLVINNSPLLTSIDVNLSQGQLPEHGFVDSNVVSNSADVLQLNTTNVQTAVGEGFTYTSVSLSPLADSNLFNQQFGAKKATNTPNTVPGEIVAFNIDASAANAAGTFHGVKIPVTPPGVHLGGMGLRGIVLIARRILKNKGVVGTGDLDTDPDYGVHNYVTGNGSDNTKFARLIAGVMNKIGDLNTVDSGAESAISGTLEIQDLSDAYTNDADKFLNPFNLGLADQGTTMGRRAYNQAAGAPFGAAQSFDQYLAAIAGAFLGAGIFLSKNDWETWADDGGAPGSLNNITANETWMKETITTGGGARAGMAADMTNFSTVPTAITAAHMGELVRGIYDATCEDIPQYLGTNIPNNTDVQTALKRELTLFKVDGQQPAQDRLVHISVDDLEYGYSNAKPGLPFFRKGYTISLDGELNADPWKQSVLYSGNLSKGFELGSGDGSQDDMLYDGGLPPPNRCESVSYNGTVSNTWGTLNEVKDVSIDDLIMNYDNVNPKTTKTGNNFLGYPYQLNYFSTDSQEDRLKKYGKPKYRWAYYYSEDDSTTTNQGGVFL